MRASATIYWVVLVVVLAVVSVASQSVRAGVHLGGVTYIESSPAETVTVSFATADGGVTVSSYTGFVKIQIAGFGESLSTGLNDAFYVFTDGEHNPMDPVHVPGNYQLAFGVGPLLPLDEDRLAKRFIVYDYQQGTEVVPPYVPQYNPAHYYSFVLDTGLTVAGRLHFGVADGNYADNTGAYIIDVTQLVVPEPQCGLVFLGLSMLLVRTHPKKG